MKIVSITMVKNEVDIIESFIRYHLNIVDEMIFLDNFSSDETPIIIKNLINEGLPIVLINDKNNEYTQYIKMNILLEKAFKEHDADIVCVLDVDEFIITPEKTNPREILENIDSTFYYLVKWTTYVPTKNDNPEKFIPKRITYVRDPKLEEFYKVIVPKNIFYSFNAKITMGNHNLSFENVNGKPAANKDLNLKIAHFPIRSKEQCMSKVLVGWPNLISINTDDQPWGWHWKNIFDKIKKNNTINDEDLETFAKNYALNNPTHEITLQKSPINLDFCKDIEIKYDNYSYNYLNNILDNSIQLANEIKILKNKEKR